jgi:CRISPR type III-B/RAMP module-associated protein Cmr3
MPLKHTFTLEPRDLLFLRDARPMAASDAGLGANWPRPDQLWNAIINAFHRQWPGPELQPWEGIGKHTFRGKRDADYKGKSKDKNDGSSFRFGALKTLGPFPCKEGTLYLPAPLDLGMELVPCTGTDLPAPLTHAFLPRQRGKQASREWVSVSDYARYLAGDDLPEPTDTPDLYDVERNIGIEIDGETQTTVEGQFYQAEYLRLRQGVALAFEAECDLKPRGGGQTVDVFARSDRPDTLVIGGQQGVAYLNTQQAGLELPHAEITTSLLRWTLLSPAVFKDGWLPGWCHDSRKLPEPQLAAPIGTVMLPGAEARLIAARIGKPLAFSGWDLQKGAPKPTLLAVPAGSCYVFDCGTVESARVLSKLLQNSPRSDKYGEKGFGAGICSSLPPVS